MPARAIHPSSPSNGNRSMPVWLLNPLAGSSCTMDVDRERERQRHERGRDELVDPLLRLVEPPHQEQHAQAGRQEQDDDQVGRVLVEGVEEPLAKLLPAHDGKDQQREQRHGGQQHAADAVRQHDGGDAEGDPR